MYAIRRGEFVELFKAEFPALKWLLADATRKPLENVKPQSFSTPDSREPAEDPLPQQELCHRARAIIANRADPFALAPQLLAYVSDQHRTLPRLRGMVATLQPQPSLPSSPSIRLLALCQFSQCGMQIDELNAPLVIGYSEVLEALVSSPHSFNAAVYSSLRAQFLRLFEDPEPKWSQLLPLYSAVLVSEARLCNGNLVALDLFSDALDTILAYQDLCDVKSTYTTILRLVHLAINNQVDATECLQAFVVLQPKDSRLKELSLQECDLLLNEFLSEPRGEPNSLPTIATWYRRLNVLDADGLATKIFVRGCQIAGKRGQSGFLTKLGNTLENAIESKVESHRLKHVLSVIERGELASPNEFLRALERITDVRQLETLATHRVLTGTAIAGVDRLRDPTVSQLVSPELLRTRLNHWQELNAIHRGFTSRLISAKRGPFREPPDLVQFAIDVGAEDSVKYFNAKDFNQFPGKGFFVTRLRLDKCFAPQSPIERGNDKASYDVYKRAWPTLAEAMDRFDDAEFVFLRGCLIISCKHRDYLLPSGIGEHYSLLVFNDHFRNPFQEVAYLLPNQGVAKLLSKTQIPYADFVGFDPRRPDLNTQLQSPQNFLGHPMIKDKAIDVGGISAILSGFESHLHRFAALSTPSELRSSADAIRQKTDAHNREILRWEERNHRYHLSQVGQTRMLELSEAGQRLQREANRIGQLQAEVLDRTEELIWQLVDKYTALHKLLCIAHAYWHRGYTAGRLVSTRHIDDSIQDDDSIPSASLEQRQLQLEESSEPIVNRNAIRMLVQAYEWHAMSENPASRRDDFPILVICDATQIGSQPDLDVYIDTCDMSAHVDGQRVELSKGRMAGDDELFWMTSIIPRVRDERGKIRDLRFYPRASLGIE